MTEECDKILQVNGNVLLFSHFKKLMPLYIFVNSFSLMTWFHTNMVTDKVSPFSVINHNFCAFKINVFLFTYIFQPGTISLNKLPIKSSLCKGKSYCHGP